MIDPLPSDIFSAGQLLTNTYQIQGVLGRGGTGEVYRAENIVNGRIVALKALNAQFSGNEGYLELMKREEEVRAINHEAIVRYTHCSRSDKGQVFLVMDFVDGPSLADVMFERRPSDHDLMVLARRVLQGLEAAHAQHIVHRDLSPDNIILSGGDPAGATIIDFGIAKDASVGAHTIVGNNFAGKYEYAAPEQLEGHAEFRTDFYALGTSLLAAAMGEVPDVGSAPGEIVRRKKQPLDTSRLKGPLRELVDWLTAPDLSDRPRNAGEAVAKLDQILNPKTEKSARKSRKWIWLPLGAVAIASLGLFFAFIGAELWTEPLPHAEPFRLSASFDGQNTTFTGHAPDQETANQLTSVMTDVTGADIPEGQLQLSQGQPMENWSTVTQELLVLISQLEYWDIQLSGTTASVSGLATNGAVRDQLMAELDRWKELGTFDLSQDIVVGPETLTLENLHPVLHKLSTCGPIKTLGNRTSFALFETIELVGNVAQSGDAANIKAGLTPIIGDRKIQVSTITLNPNLCAIKAVLPQNPALSMSLRLTDGKTGRMALSGIFHPGDNPVLDVEFAQSITEMTLSVMVIQNTGQVVHIFPRPYHIGLKSDEIGQVTNGIRSVRVLWTHDQQAEDGRRLALNMTEGDYGKSEIIAILSDRPLFVKPRPQNETATELASALAQIVTSDKVKMLGIASRIIDLRP